MAWDKIYNGNEKSETIRKLECKRNSDILIYDFFFISIIYGNLFPLNSILVYFNSD